MEELLQNIVSLRDYINNLTEISEKKVYERCDLAIKIAAIEEEIENMKLTKDNLEEDIMDFKLKKGVLFTLPIGILISILFFSYLIFVCWDKLTIGISLFTVIGAPALSISVAFMLSSFLIHSKIFTNSLIKKYSAIKEINNKLNNLIVRNRIVENNLNDIMKQKEEVTYIIINYEEIIQSKKEELHKLEQKYFNNFNDTSIINSTSYEVSKTGKKRSRNISESH